MSTFHLQRSWSGAAQAGAAGALRCLALLALVFMGALPAGCIAEERSGFDEQMLALLRNEVTVPDRYPMGRWLRDIYADDAGPVWFSLHGARPAVADALRVLRTADERGLRPDDYAVPVVERAVASALNGNASDIAHADVALTAAMLHLLSDLHVGRVAPRAVAPNWQAPGKPASFVAGLRAAVADARIDQLVAAAEPQLALYGRLAQVLAQYRALAREPDPLPLPPLAASRAKIASGDHYQGLPALRARLVRLGDLPRDAVLPVDDIYGGEIVAAVRRFQTRHGLDPDGVIGSKTLAALAVSANDRVRQIELAMERLRWLPEPDAGPLIAINIPSFRLWAFADGRRTEHATLAMPVIVGRSLRNETPIFRGTMRFVEFQPYWNVPHSILRDELLPRLARDPGYLAREDMELVSTLGDGQVSTSVDADTLAALEAGRLRVRQRPGPKNALGGIKFVLPNTMDIYLHATPAASLFARTRRDFSHGCIRLGEPAALAQFVLADQTQWTPRAIDAAMTPGSSNVLVKLTRPVPVLVFYTTTAVDGEGRALFLPDIYGDDRKLLAALARARAGA